MTINNIEYEIGIYDLEGNFIDSTDDWDVLEKEFSLNKTGIRNHFNRNCYKISVYQLVFKNKEISSSKLPLKVADVTNLTNLTGLLPVAKYYKNKLITCYKSINEASRLTGLNSGNIVNSCNKGHKTGIFNFKYIQ